ncbi:MAG: FixH family protein [Rickettsiales bacterium]|jgi:nitrogen fixation protein FixH|nr:FixH family protein [Rickettsiales bacterium]
MKKSKIPYLFFAFFAVIIAVDSYYIYLSQKTWHGIVGDSSNKFNKTQYQPIIDKEKKQNSLNWQVAININNLSQRKIKINISAKDKNLQTINFEKIIIDFRRAGKEEFDFSINKNNINDIIVEFPDFGRWQASYSLIDKKGNIYQDSKNYLIK